jgi:hypothetical protein
LKLSERSNAGVRTTPHGSEFDTLLLMRDRLGIVATQVAVLRGHGIDVDHAASDEMLPITSIVFAAVSGGRSFARAPGVGPTRSRTR